MSKGNLSPTNGWKKGQSGNPQGRKTTTWGAIYKELLSGSEIKVNIQIRDLKTDKIETKELFIKNDNNADIENRNTLKWALASIHLYRAMQGDYKIAEMIMNRTEGKVPEVIDYGDDRPKPDLSKLSDDELKVLDKISKKMFSEVKLIEEKGEKNNG